MNAYLGMIKSVTTRHDRIIKNASASFCEYFNIIQFWYNRVDDRGSLASLSNHPAWTEYFATQQLYAKCPLLRHSKHLPEGVVLFNNDGVEKFLNRNIVNIFYKEEENYNKNVWVVLIVKTKNGSDQFGFLANRSNIELIINELKLIKWFMKKFPLNIPSIFAHLEDERISLIDLIGPSFYKGETPAPMYHHPARKALLQQMRIGDDFRLKSKEIEVIKLILQGFSASAIAPQVFLAKRTIDHLIERIKEKLQCSSKTELIQKARELEELGYLDSSLFVDTKVKNII